MEFRKALCEALDKLMAKDDKIVVLDADLSKPNGTSPLYKKYPDRCFNSGIAEANMIGMASGLAAYGYKPVCVTFTPFATRRVCDQIAISVCYANLNVKIIGTDPGICAETNGGTHMSMEDIGVLRSIPNMKIIDFVDSTQVLNGLEEIMNYNGPIYMRMPRKLDYSIFDSNEKYNLFKASTLLHGNDYTILASGTMVKEALDAANKLKDKGINCEVISVNSIKPLDKEIILESVKRTNHVITCENHNIIGGLYRAVSELLSSEYPIKIKSIGVNDEFGQVGSYNDLLKYYHMTSDDIVKKVLE